MKTVAFIPIKLNNERIPGKNTKKFADGTALVSYFQQVLIESAAFDEIYVFCSNDKIKDYLYKGVRYLKRPEYLDTKEATPQDIMHEFIKVINADIYAVCHCTSPFVTKEHIRECVEAVKSGKYDSSFTGEKVQKLVWTEKNEPLNFNADNIPRTQDLPVYHNEVSAAYVFTKTVFEKYNRRIGINPYITEVSGVETIDIDYPEDFEMANLVYMYMLREKNL